jgi:hypothetical protein
MANNFKNINYATMLYESLRNYYSINSNEEASILYKYCAAILSPLQPAFDNYNAFRIREAIIANCKWQIGQLTNVLNYLFDNELSRIFITQSELTIVSLDTFAYPPVHTAGTFAMTPTLQTRVFGDKTEETLVAINIPSSISLSQVKAVVEQIRMQGIPYQIITF